MLQKLDPPMDLFTIPLLLGSNKIITRSCISVWLRNEKECVNDKEDQQASV
jgi:hypothetical protein